MFCLPLKILQSNNNESAVPTGELRLQTTSIFCLFMPKSFYNTLTKLILPMLLNNQLNSWFNTNRAFTLRSAMARPQLPLYNTSNIPGKPYRSTYLLHYCYIKSKFNLSVHSYFWNIIMSLILFLSLYLLLPPEPSKHTFIVFLIF